MKKIVSKIQITFLTLVLMLIIPMSSYGTDGQRKISQTPSTTFPITISQAGSYVLTSNLVVTDPNVNAIEITTNDVTLDLNGHMIQGPHTGSPWGGTGNGIYAENRYNISVKNGKLWGFGGSGIHLSSSFGDPSFEGAGHWIDKIQAANNGDLGIFIYGGLVTNCTANNNGNIGIITYNSTITNCTANNNGSSGIMAVDSTITSCTANKNNFCGFYVVNASINNCTANKNQQGIYGEGPSRIEGNNLRHNNSYGLRLVDPYMYVIKNVASGNGISNFFDEMGGNYMPICGVDATDNCNYGF
jgi:hypothetical protein